MIANRIKVATEIGTQRLLDFWSKTLNVTLLRSIRTHLVIRCFQLDMWTDLVRFESREKDALVLARETIPVISSMIQYFALQYLI